MHTHTHSHNTHMPCSFYAFEKLQSVPTEPYFSKKPEVVRQTVAINENMEGNRAYGLRAKELSGKQHVNTHKQTMLQQRHI